MSIEDWHVKENSWELTGNQIYVSLLVIQSVWHFYYILRMTDGLTIMELHYEQPETSRSLGSGLMKPQWPGLLSVELPWISCRREVFLKVSVFHTT